MANHCHTFYLRTERWLKTLFRKEATPYMHLAVPGYHHLPVRNPHKNDTVKGKDKEAASRLHTCCGQHTGALQLAPPKNYFPPTSLGLTGTCGSLGLYLFFNKFYNVIKSMAETPQTQQAQYCLWSYLYPSARNMQWPNTAILRYLFSFANTHKTYFCNPYISQNPDSSLHYVLLSLNCQITVCHKSYLIFHSIDISQTY